MRVRSISRPPNQLKRRFERCAWSVLAMVLLTGCSSDADILAPSRPSTASATAVDEPLGKPHEKPDEKEKVEKEKVEKLISVVAAQHDAKFIRNGTAYSATEAADHLHMKLASTKSPIESASDFIEKLASKSSVSGKDYLIEFPDGRTITVGEFLHGELAKLEKPAEDLTAKKP